jgi:hypothetical protein
MINQQVQFFFFRKLYFIENFMLHSQKLVIKNNTRKHVKKVGEIGSRIS